MSKCSIYILDSSPDTTPAPPVRPKQTVDLTAATISALPDYVRKHLPPAAGGYGGGLADESIENIPPASLQPAVGASSQGMGIGAKQAAFQRMLDDRGRVGLQPAAPSELTSARYLFDDAAAHENAGVANPIVPSDPLADYRPQPWRTAVDPVDEEAYPYERVTEEQAEKDLRDLVEGAYEGENASDIDESEAIPDGLTCKLLPHQQISLRWMLSRERGKKRGGILADDVRISLTTPETLKLTTPCRWVWARPFRASL